MILLSAQTTRMQTGILTCARLDGISDDANEEQRNIYRRQRKIAHERTETKSRAVASSKRTKMSAPIPNSQAKTGAKSKTPKHVSFGFVHVREHALTVGDHEWCDGDSLPITLDWRHAQPRSIGVDDYEWIKQRQGRTPRGRLMKLDDRKRKYLLRKVSGVSAEFIEDMIEIRKEYSLQRMRQRYSKIVTKYPKQ